MMNLPQKTNFITHPITGLYAITAQQQLQNPEQLYLAIHQVLRGGAKVIQYRDKLTIDRQQRRQIAQTINNICHLAHYQACFIVNDDVELAIDINADGLHIGQNDTQYSQAREQLPHKIIGVSCYDDLDYARQMQAQGADYVAFGRFFSSKTKPSAIPANIDLLTRAARDLTIPIVAIGGIRIENAQPLIQAGAQSLAVIDGVFGQSNIQQCAEKLTELFTQQSRASYLKSHPNSFNLL